MPLCPSIIEHIARARNDLRLGVPVVLVHKSSGTAVLIAAIETLAPGRFDEMRALGQMNIILTPRRAATLNIATHHHNHFVCIKAPSYANLNWCMAVADPAKDLDYPLKGPFSAHHIWDDTSAHAALHLTKSAQLLPAILSISIKDPHEFSQKFSLTLIDLEEAAPHFTALATFSKVSNARVPSIFSPYGRVHVFRPQNGGEEHYVIEIGTPDRHDPVLTRLHSACFTGDVIGSLKCDCGPQLHGALEQMGQAGTGLLLYLNQEGRGIGLANKMRAYALQDQGFDTVEANYRLGFEDDERDFRIGAALLRHMGFSTIRLLTNNPKKITMMAQHGITIAERVPLKVGHGALNRDYLATKAAKSGHLL